jgi:SAM-dependent methyltransferase
MAHGEQREFFEKVKAKFPDNFENKWVLEVGSLDINGTVRDFFTNCHYVGIDVGPGPGVDAVADGSTVNFPANQFDTSVSAECFEHNPSWAQTFSNMRRMTKKDGLIVFTCASDGRPEHGTSRSDVGSSPLTVNLGWEYYGNLNEADFQREFDLDHMFSDYEFEYNPVSCDLYFWGVVKK